MQLTAGKTAVESPLAGWSLTLTNRISWDAWKVCRTQTSNPLIIAANGF